ncbi:unnamed protein product [Adineta ricciae]|uniref:Ricin B lectin domain-containing protein n=1 Tax=Adineta ricciae TaxID=249248 RepID=A0A813PTJ4_ADIRI|nr:unnamed protein product [Adineta ricciae]CAF0910202.1 unnamed protein product [Adineta ricciae]
MVRRWHFTAAILIYAFAALPIISTESITAFQADSFVESIGVNTHWAYPNVYTKNYTGLRAKLGESGIRYVRDGAYTNIIFTRANDLYNSFGIKTNMLTGRWVPGMWPSPLDPTQIDAELNDIKTLALQATAAIEAPNEYDHAHGPDTDWASTIKTYSVLLYNKVKADPLLKNITVIGPSFVEFEAYQTIGNSDSFLDHGNQHLYYWTYWPGFSGYDTNGTRSISWYLDYVAPQQSPSRKPVQGTEAGHTNFIDVGGISEEADGKYMARIFAEFYRHGIYRTYKYELVDQALSDREGFFGLLRNDLSEKPAFRAVKHLIAILSDKGSSFTPKALSYTLTGSLNNVRQILFQKRNGDFYLMVWTEVSSWDVSRKVNLYPSSQQVQLILQGSYKLSNATLYTFDNNADLNIFYLPITNNQVTFNSTDKISIIRLRNETNSITEGLYRITPKFAAHAGLYASSNQNNAFVSQEQYWGSANQQWIFEPIDGNFFVIKNRAFGRVLTVHGCNTDDGGALQIYDWTNSDCQKWTFELLPNGYYRITPKHALNQCIEVQMCSTSIGATVLQWSWSNSDCQQWKLEWIGSTY